MKSYLGKNLNFPILYWSQWEDRHESTDYWKMMECCMYCIVLAELAIRFVDLERVDWIMISTTIGPILTILRVFESILQVFRSPLFRQEPNGVVQATLCLDMSELVGARGIDAAGI